MTIAVRGISTLEAAEGARPSRTSRTLFDRVHRDPGSAAMKRLRVGFMITLVSPLAIACGSARLEQAGATSEALSQEQGTGPFHNAAGQAANLSTTGTIDFSNAFFQSLGRTDGRVFRATRPRTAFPSRLVRFNSSSRNAGFRTTCPATT